MNLFKRIFKTRRKNISVDEQKTKNQESTNKNNPAFEYVKDKYGIDCNIYQKLSTSIYDHSIAAANEFAKATKGKTNEKLQHFFFDYFLSFYVSTKTEYFHFNNSDAFSAIIDGIHIKYYGNVSDEIIGSIIQLWATKNNCFLKTNMAALKNKNTNDRTRFMIAIASYCAGIENAGATQVLQWIKPFNYIQNSKLSSIDTFFNLFMNN